MSVLNVCLRGEIWYPPGEMFHMRRWEQKEKRCKTNSKGSKEENQGGGKPQKTEKGKVFLTDMLVLGGKRCKGAQVR